MRQAGRPPVMTSIEHYELERRLGAGAFATVWLAHDPVLDGKVAIKVLAENWSFDDEVKRRFMDEARLMHRASDPHFVRVLRAGELDSGQPYLVMDYADRGTLADRLQDPASKLSVDEAVELIDAIADCARAVHAHGFIHRDIKPSNVLITSTVNERATSMPPLASDERLLLADFGLAKDMAAASGFTRAGGSPAYMAPEQTRSNHELDQRVDVHALGVTAFEVLTGTGPVDASTESSLELPPVSSVHPHLAAFDAVIAKATAAVPANRHANVDAFLADVHNAQRSLLDVASPAEPAEPSSPRRLVAAVIAGALLIGVAGGFLWRAQNSESTGKSAGEAAAAGADNNDGSTTPAAPDGDDQATSTEAETKTEETSEPELIPIDITGDEDLCELRERPAGALVNQPGPVFCTLAAPEGELATAETGENYLIDEFDHGLTEAPFNTAAYLDFDLGGSRSVFWLTDNHLLLDIESSGEPSTALLRPTRPFLFEDDRFVVEMDTAAGPTAISDDRYALAEFIVINQLDGELLRLADRASQAFFDQYTLGCAVDPRRIFSCELVGAGSRSGLDQGRVWRVSPTGPEGEGISADVTVGDLAADQLCRPDDRPGDCTNRYRVELQPTSLRVEVNGVLLFEQTGLPPLPADFVAGELFVFFAGHNSGLESEIARITWDRVAINPDNALLTRIEAEPETDASLDSDGDVEPDDEESS